MLPEWVSNPGPLTYESGALPIALHGPAPGNCQNFLLKKYEKLLQCKSFSHFFNKKYQCIWLSRHTTGNKIGDPRKG